MNLLSGVFDNDIPKIIKTDADGKCIVVVDLIAKPDSLISGIKHLNFALHTHLFIYQIP